MKLIMGIDPGLSGAMAWLDYDTRMLIAVEDMPIIQLKKKNIDPYQLTQIIDLRAKNTMSVVIEDVTASPQMGVTSSFNFGCGFGMVKAAVASCYLTMHMVRPSVWKPALGLSRDKNKSRTLAIKLWPKQAKLFARVKDDGRAEAALLAWFGAQNGL